MANYSRGWAGTISQSATAAPDWTNLSHATVSDDAYAQCTMTDQQDSEWLIATNFSWQRAVPSGATVVGVTVFIEGYNTPAGPDEPQGVYVQLQDARLVIGGTIQTGGPSVGIGRRLGRGVTPDQYELIAGGETDLWAQTPSQAQAAASTFGVALKFRAIDYDMHALVDSIRMVIWWEKDPACVITPITPTSGGQAPFQFIAHALESNWDDSLPQEVTFKWTVTGPQGWSQTVEDPRRGGWQDPTRNLATLWGKCPQWLFDVPGEYTVNCTMYRTLSDGTFQTTSATAVTVEVDENTRAKRYVKQTGNDSLNGESEVNAWATLRRASQDSLKTDVEIIVLDDGTITESVGPAFHQFENLWIHRSGGGTNPPTIKHSNDVNLSRFSECETVVVQGLNFAYKGTGSFRPIAIGGWSNRFLCIADCSHDGCDSFCEFSSIEPPVQEGLLLLRCDGTDHKRYMLFTNGDHARLVAVIGGVWETSRAISQEGQLRVQDANLFHDRGWGFLMAFVHNSQSNSVVTYDSCRHGWSEQDVYANRFGRYGDFNMASNADTTTQSFEFNSRFEANDMEHGDSMPWGERAQYVLLASNYLVADKERQIADVGVSLSFKVVLNTLIISDAIDDAHFWRTRAASLGGTLHDGFGHSIVGNLWITELPPGTAGGTWVAKYWRNEETNRSIVADFAYNVYNDDGSGSGTVKRWRELNTDYDLIGWNGLSIASNEIYVANLHGGTGGTLPQAANSWALSPSSFAATRHIPPGAVRGVFFDYRLVMRDPTEDFWAAGCTGDEP